LSNQELIAEGTNDLLKKQQVEKIPISPIFVQNIDVSINLAIGVSFLRKVCPKSCIVFQKLHCFPKVATPHSMVAIQRIGVLLDVFFIFFIMEFLILLVAPK
jgi:hypothetical protein